MPPYYHNGFNQRLSHQNLPQYNPYYMHYPINAYQRGPEYQEDIRVNTPLDQNTSLPLYAQYPFVGSGFNPNFHMRPAFCDERAKVNLHYSLEGGDMGQERRFDTKKQ